MSDVTRVIVSLRPEYAMAERVAEFLPTPFLAEVGGLGAPQWVGWSRVRSVGTGEVVDLPPMFTLTHQPDAVPTEDGATLTELYDNGTDAELMGYLTGSPTAPVLPAEPTDEMVRAFLRAENDAERQYGYGRIDQHAVVVAGLRAALAAGDPR